MGMCLLHLENYGEKDLQGRKFKVAVIDRQFWGDFLLLDLSLNGELTSRAKCHGGQIVGKVLGVHLYLFTAQMQR